MCTRDNNDLLFHSLWLLYKLYYIILYSIFYLLFPCFFLTDFANRFKILEILELYLFTNIYIYIFILQIFFKDIYSNLILFLLIFFCILIKISYISTISSKLEITSNIINLFIFSKINNL